MRILLLALLVVGCKHSHERSHVVPDFDAFEKKWVAEGDVMIEQAQKEGRPITDADRKGIEAYHGIFIGKDGVIIDRKPVATLAELKTKRDELKKAIDANRALMPTFNMSPIVVLDLEPQPAAVAIDALELFVGTTIMIRVRDTSAEPTSTRLLYYDRALRDTRLFLQKPTVSVYLTANKLWIGESVVNEFYEIPDKSYGRDDEKLQTTLRELKNTDVLADRNDIEIAADGGTAGGVLTAIEAAMDAGFNDIAILPVDQLSAKPQL